jgi:hypothetical protein
MKLVVIGGIKPLCDPWFGCGRVSSKETLVSKRNRSLLGVARRRADTSNGNVAPRFKPVYRAAARTRAAWAVLPGSALIRIRQW